MAQNFAAYHFSKHTFSKYIPGWHPALLTLCALWLAACTATPLTTTPITAKAKTSTAHAPTLGDFWEGNARFELEIADTGLPMGESDTLILADGTWRTVVHASYLSLGVLDQCGAPVKFPGCLVLFNSTDEGQTFAPTLSSTGAPVCQIPCSRCPCDSRRDHIDQQQYPRVASHSTTDNLAGNLPDQWVMTYEYRANTILRHSSDGLQWSPPAQLPLTGIWQNWLMPCRPEGAIGLHPYAPSAYDCLVGSPPGIFIDEKSNPAELYIFVGLGQNPSGMGCYRGPVNGSPALLRACDHNPLFVGASDYGPLDSQLDSLEDKAAANPHFDFRTISSADLIHVGDHYYLFYEGVRGPGPEDQGDTQFLLGLARSASKAIDGLWELYPANPILLDLPGNVGVGHADGCAWSGSSNSIG